MTIANTDASNITTEREVHISAATVPNLEVKLRAALILIPNCAITSTLANYLTLIVSESKNGTSHEPNH